MNYFIALALLALLFSCGEKSLTKGNSLSEPGYLLEKSKNNNTSNADQDLLANLAENSKRSVTLKGHRLNVFVEGKRIEVMELPKIIGTSLKLTSFHRAAVTTTVDKLRDECRSMNYKSQKYHFITGIRGAIFINPFTSFDVKLALSRQSVPFLPGKLPGAFDATGAHPEIIASYLTKPELASLKAWFDAYLKFDKKAFDFEIWDDLDDLTPPRVPILELSRLICGILLQEARMDFVLSTDDGRTLRVKVDNVSFDH